MRIAITSHIFPCLLYYIQVFIFYTYGIILKYN
ncbi:hypothetical protein [Campylobacter phage CJLB-12]|nr:hypothetical protein [Campylobacter phage CJLB-12]